MKLSEKLYLSVKDIWDSYNEHPFVKGIETGNLDIDKFKFYMIQDYLYLLEYSRVFALGIVKAKDEETMRLFAESVNSILNSETTIHKSYMSRLEITKEEVEEAKASIDNISYTNYMLSVAQSQGLLELIVSVLSCSWSYKIIADKINERSDTINHEFYGEWVKGYVSEEYARSNNIIINLVDKFGENITECEADNLINIFRNCSRYEYMFWDMAYNKKN